MAVLETLDISPRERKRRLESLLEELNIAHLAKSKAYTLSGGERRRLEITRALVTNPSFLLLDEPFSSLDPRATGWLIDFLNSLDSTLIMALHNMELAREIAERVIVLSENHEIIYDGDINNFANNKEELVKAGLWHRHSGKEPHFHNF